MKSALLVGVAYGGTEYELPGCINDVMSIADFAGSRGFREVTIMRDNLPLSSDEYPSRNKVITRLYRMVKSMGSNDSLWLHFSGHGFYVGSGNEISTTGGSKIAATANQCILLRNEDRASLTDIDETNTLCEEQLVRLFHNLHGGARVLVTVDACASGNMFDLRYNVQVAADSSSDRASFTMQEQHERDLDKNVAIFTAVNKLKFAWDAEPKGMRESYGVFSMLLMTILKQMVSEGKSLSYLDLLYLLHARFQDRVNKQDPQLSVPTKETIEHMVWV